MSHLNIQGDKLPDLAGASLPGREEDTAPPNYPGETPPSLSELSSAERSKISDMIFSKLEEKVNFAEQFRGREVSFHDEKWSESLLVKFDTTVYAFIEVAKQEGNSAFDQLCDSLKSARPIFKRVGGQEGLVIAVLDQESLAAVAKCPEVIRIF